MLYLDLNNVGQCKYSQDVNLSKFRSLDDLAINESLHFQVVTMIVVIYLHNKCIEMYQFKLRSKHEQVNYFDIILG